MGDAEGGSQVPRKASLDIFHDRRSYPRGIPVTQGSVLLPVALYGGSFPCHRRLDFGHERYPPIYLKVWAEPPGAKHRASTDTHSRPHCQPTERDRQLQARTLLGVGHDLSRYAVYRYQGKVHHQGGRRAGFSDHRGKALYRYRCHQEARNRGSAKAL